MKPCPAAAPLDTLLSSAYPILPSSKGITHSPPPEHHFFFPALSLDWPKSETNKRRPEQWSVVHDNII